MSEMKRIEAMLRYHALDVSSDVGMRDLTHLAGELLDAPVCVILLVGEDECFLKSMVGFEAPTLIRNQTFCHYTIETGKVMVVEDATHDSRFANSIYVKGEGGARAYAGAPLISSDGYVIGTLSVGYYEVRTFTPMQIRSLEKLAGIAMQIYEAKLRLKAQQDADDASEKYKEFTNVLLENLTDGIVACDENAHLTVFNQALRRFHGLSERHELSPNDWNHYYSLFHADGTTLMQPHEIPLMRAFKGEILKDVEMVVITRGGERRSLVCSGQALFSKDRKKLGAVVALQDVTERKKSQEKLEATNKELIEATKAKSDFLANMSHEVRTPLNGVIGVTDLLLEGQLTPDHRKSMELIQTSANSLLTIVSDILDFSKVEAGKLEIDTLPFDLELILKGVHQSLDLAAKKKKLKLYWSVAEKSNLHFMGDPGRIQQVLMNLVSNAIKFTSEGFVSTSVVVTSKNSQESSIRIEVKDSGMGISEEAIARLFQAFTQADTSTTRRFGGTGLGLSISKKLMELMNGKIGVDSTEGQGSVFWISIDLPNAKIMDSAPTLVEIPPPVGENAGPQNFRILVADDNSLNMRISLSMLRLLGLSADSVENGVEALNAMRERTYDLVLMDCQMPEMDGYEATSTIRSETKSPNSSTPIIAITAHAMAGDREKCLTAGMTDYLSKPIRLKDLEGAIARYIPIRIRGAS